MNQVASPPQPTRRKWLVLGLLFAGASFAVIFLWPWGDSGLWVAFGLLSLGIISNLVYVVGRRRIREEPPAPPRPISPVYWVLLAMTPLGVLAAFVGIWTGVHWLAPAGFAAAFSSIAIRQLLRLPEESTWGRIAAVLGASSIGALLVASFLHAGWLFWAGIWGMGAFFVFTLVQVIIEKPGTS
jgi:hypothetical protein